MYLVALSFKNSFLLLTHESMKAIEKVKTVVFRAEKFFKLILSRKTNKKRNIFHFSCYGYEISFKILYIVACQQVI